MMSISAWDALVGRRWRQGDYQETVDTDYIYRDGQVQLFNRVSRISLTSSLSKL